MATYAVKFTTTQQGATDCATTATARDTIAKLALRGATIRKTKRGIVYVKTDRGYLKLERVKC